MQKALEIKEEFYKEWVSPESGLALLGRGHKDNDNGILFYAFFIMILHLAKASDDKDLERAFNLIKKLEVAPGLFSRLPNNAGRMEAHDNYVGICALSAIYEFAFPREIVEFGTAHGFAYDNKNPENPAKESIRQGGDIAFYKLCTGFVPTIWELVWMIGGMLTAAFKGSPSTINLTWLRFKTLNIVMAKSGKLPMFSLSLGLILVTEMIFKLSIYKRLGGIQGSFAQYYTEEHPIRRLAKELNL